MFDYMLIIAFLVVLDTLWLSLFMGPYYTQVLGSAMPEKITILSAICFYGVCSFAMLIFVVLPHDMHGYTISSTFLRGGLLGLLAYLAYDLTNHSVVKGWTWRLTLLDLSWGFVMVGIVSVAVVLI